MRYLLGIDLGTSGIKATIFDLNGRAAGRGYRAIECSSPGQGWAEQDPRSWWSACCVAVKCALNVLELDAREIASVGVCGFHHCPVFLDADGEPTRPTIVTHDVRLGESLDTLKQTGVWGRVVEETGSLVLTGHFPPIYHYVFENDRQAVDRCRWIILAKDYIRWKLTGKVATEICDATGTNLVAMPEQHWSDALCELLAVPWDKLPHIGESSKVCGEITPEAAEQTGLAAGTPVVYGGGDSHCALLGLGVTGTGEVGLLLGTNSTLRASFAGFVHDPNPGYWAQQHIVPGKFTISVSSMAGSSILSWFKGILCDETWGGDVYRELESLASSADPGCDGLMFHPYIHGERSPFCNPAARGSFVGLAHWHNRGHFVRGVMEGVAFCIANCFAVTRQVASNRGEQISLIRIGEGGGGRIELWKQIIADVLGFPLQTARAKEPGCLGAAILAGVGVGVFEDVEDGVAQVVELGADIVPNPATSEVYRQVLERFNRSYKVLESALY